MRKKVSIIQQSEHSECGLACVVMLLNYYGINTSLSKLRDKYGVPKGGNTLTHLKHILDEYGIDTMAIRVLSKESLLELTEPCICYWENSHFVVMEKYNDKKILICDPATGRVSMTPKEFDSHFSDISLIITKTEVKEKRKKKNATIGVLANILKERKLQVIFFILLTLVLQLLNVIIPQMTQRLIDNSPQVKSNFYQILFMVVILFIGFYILQVVRGLQLNTLQRFFDLRLMDGFMKKILSLPLQFFVNRSTGDLIFRANLGTLIQQVLSQRMLVVIVDFFFIFVYLILMASYSLELTAVSVLVAILIGIISIINSKKFQTLTDKELVSQSMVQRILVEMFEGIETLKMNNATESFFRLWKENFTKQVDLRTEKNKYYALYGNIPIAIQFVLPIFLLLLGIVQIDNGALSLGEMVSFLALSSAFLTPIMTISSAYTDLLTLRTYFDRIGEIYEITVPKKKKNNQLKVIKKFDSIEMRNVSFKYSYFENEILSKIYLKIVNGEKVAIVGRSGSGKSTLLNLLSGMYQPNKGNIYLNRIKFSNISEKSLNKKISVVNQSPTIFNNSLLENIILNNKNISQSIINKAIRDSKVDEIIKNLPLGLQTQLSENGMNLSGGQKQRIAIARALVTQPDILLMDEPTSSLDNISENYIMKRIKEHRFACVIVAHRLNTIRHFDRILVMDDGKIIEEGSHESLIRNRGLYRRIYSETSQK